MNPMYQTAAQRPLSDQSALPDPRLTMASPSYQDDDALARALRHLPRGLHSAPQGVIQAAIDLYRSPAPAAPSLLDRLQALMSFDSRLSLAAGVRNATLGAPVRQLVFTAPGCDVDLRIEPLLDAQGEGQVQVSGQLLGPQGEVQAWLQVAGQEWRAPCDELSSFRFDRVPAGATTLRLQSAQWELTLPLFDTTP